VSKFNLFCDVIRADEQGDGYSGFFNYRSQIYKVVTVTVIEGKHQRGLINLIRPQHLDRFMQRHNPIVFLQKPHVPQEVCGRNAHPVRPVAYKVMKKNCDGKTPLKSASPIPGGYRRNGRYRFQKHFCERTGSGRDVGWPALGKLFLVFLQLLRRWRFEHLSNTLLRGQIQRSSGVISNGTND
jgi:hypothetical protein